MIVEAATVTNEVVKVREFTRQDGKYWDAFVRQSPDGLPLHLSGWRDVMRDTYGYDTYYLLAEEKGEICGVLPLFAVSSFLTGSRLMTMPGGLCANSESAAGRLLENAIAISEKIGFGSVVLQDSRQTWDSAWQSQSSHVYWLLSLPGEEENLWKALDGNVRRQVRKARKNGLTAEIDRSGTLLEPFYDMFSRFTHQVGTPVFSRKFLENIVKTFPGAFNINLVWYHAEPIAGYFQLEMGDTMYGLWGAALPATLNLRPAYLALWEIMRDAIDSGFNYLDMGRSPAGSNASKFKGQWGGVSAPVYQLTSRENGAHGEDSVTNQVQSDQKFQRFMQVWPKLPLSVTRRLGPWLRRHVPFA